jgi:hypothetical protein
MRADRIVRAFALRSRGSAEFALRTCDEIVPHESEVRFA